MSVKANVISKNRTMFIAGGLIVLALLTSLVLYFGLLTLPSRSPVIVEPVADASAARSFVMNKFRVAQMDARQSGTNADAARWIALGEFYTAPVDAYTARWVGLGEYYTAPVNAYTARWTALADFYFAQDKLATDADAARWTAMGEFYMSQDKSAGDYK